MKPIILITALALIGSHWAVYKWSDAKTQAKQSKAVTEALSQRDIKLAEQYKIIDKLVTDYNQQVLDNESRESTDQRRIRQFRRKLETSTNRLDASLTRNMVYRNAFRLLNESTGYSDLPDSDHPIGANEAYETTTEFELLSYTRAVIGRYEYEGLRANKLRQVVKELSCVN